MFNEAANSNIHKTRRRSPSRPTPQAVYWRERLPASCRPSKRCTHREMPGQEGAELAGVSRFQPSAEDGPCRTGQPLVRFAREAAGASATTATLKELRVRPVPPKQHPRPSSKGGAESAVVHYARVDTRLLSKANATRQLPQEARRGVLFPSGNVVQKAELLQLPCSVRQAVTNSNPLSLLAGQSGESAHVQRRPQRSGKPTAGRCPPGPAESLERSPEPHSGDHPT